MPQKSVHRLKLITILALTMSFAQSCATPASDSFCVVAKPIHPNEAAIAVADRATLLALNDLNDAWDRLCKK